MAGFEDIWHDPNEVAVLRERLEVANTMADHYKEAYSDSARALLAAEDIGWQKLGVANSDITQISLTEAKEVSKRLHGYAESNPLLSRGREVRNSYLFSGPYKVDTEEAAVDISAQQKNIIYSDANQAEVFSMAALESIEGERYSAGQVFVLYDRTKKTFQRISFQQIGDIIYDPNNASNIWYVRRDWTATVITADGGTVQQDFKEYYPSSTYTRPDGGYASRINGVEVVDTKRMVVDRVNVQPGGNLGIPDSFAAAPWALAYSAYLSDGSKVLAALAEWAWLVKPKKQNPAERAAATVRSERGAGGTLFTDMDVAALPTSNAVDLNTGRPIAAQVASALGISIVLLLADPGQSGAYGTAQTLSDPNRRTMEARREKNTNFLIHCLKLIGVQKPVVVWPKMSPGTDKEEMELTMMAWGSGLFHEDEVRQPLADLAHITVQHDNPPAGFMYPNNSAELEKQAEAASERKVAETEAAAKAAAEQKPDGSNSMANGQGRDSLGVGKKSQTQNAGSQNRAK